MKKGINIASIESEKDFTARLALAHWIKKNPHIINKESYLFSLAGNTPELMQEVYQ